MRAGKTLSCLWVMPCIRDNNRGWIRAGSNLYPCALGRGGPRLRKREGDGATPVADMAVLGGFYRADRMLHPKSGLALAPIRVRDGWCDDPDDGRYNRPIQLPTAAGHESMMRSDRLYDVVLVLDWNITSRVRGAGSAIFLHVAHEDFRPTEGCVAVSPGTMRKLLPLLRPGTLVRLWDF